MRRNDRETSRDAAEAVIDRCVFGVLGTVSQDGTPYGVPVSVAREREWIYFHCAQKGHKTDNLKAANRVCLTCVGQASIPLNSFTLAYESAIVFGTAEEVTGDEEKIHGLRLICLKYTPDNMEAFDGAVRRLLGATRVWKIRIDRITGKEHKPPDTTQPGITRI
jgi:nitroimidazol reductase NimA-like FMN-containing flavoprotein (pyridoxamine 5'-phosphate oxidase superfamily)